MEWMMKQNVCIGDLLRHAYCTKFLIPLIGSIYYLPEESNKKVRVLRVNAVYFQSSAFSKPISFVLKDGVSINTYTLPKVVRL